MNYLHSQYHPTIYPDLVTKICVTVYRKRDNVPQILIVRYVGFERFTLSRTAYLAYHTGLCMLLEAGIALTNMSLSTRHHLHTVHKNSLVHIMGSHTLLIKTCKHNMRLEKRLCHLVEHALHIHACGTYNSILNSWGTWSLFQSHIINYCTSSSAYLYITLLTEWLFRVPILWHRC